MTMQLIQFQKVKDGRYLKNYELTYLNRAGKEKTYEIIMALPDNSRFVYMSLTGENCRFTGAEQFSLS